MAPLPDNPFEDEKLPDDPFAVEASAALPDDPFAGEELPENPLDEPEAGPTISERLNSAMDKASIGGVPVAGIKAVAGAGFDALVDNPVSRSIAGAQERLINSGTTAGNIAAAALAPFDILVGGDSPIAKTERENRQRVRLDAIRRGENPDEAEAAYKPQGPVDPLVAEKVGGSIGRIGLSGIAAPVVEGVAKVADIAMHEPEEDLSSLKTLGRGAVSAASVALPMKAGAMVANRVAQSGLGKVGGFAANAAGDLAAGYAAGVGNTVGEKALTGQEITRADFAPSATDIPFALAAGIQGAKTAGSVRRVRPAEPAGTPEQRRLASEILAEENLARQKAEADNRALRQKETEVAAEAERRRISNIAAIDDGPKQTERLALPAPSDLTSGAFPGRIQPNYPADPVNARSRLAKASLTQLQEHLGYVPKTDDDFRGLGLSPLSKKGASDGLQQREVQGETSGRPVNTESQEIAATPETQAGTGVINLAGEQGGGLARPHRFDDDPDYKQIRDSLVLTGDKVKKGKTLGERVDLIRTELFDKFRPIQKAEEQLTKSLGLGGLKAAESPYKSFRGLNRTIISKINQTINRGVPKWGTRESSTPSVQEVIAPIHGRLEDFEVLLAARRTPEMAVRQEKLPFEKDAAERVTRQIENEAGMREALSNYDKINDGVLQQAVDSGFYSQEQADAMRKANTMYAPWERVDEDGEIRVATSPAPGRRIDQPRDPLQRVTKSGSTKKIASPLETSLKNMVQIQSAIEKNAAKRKLVDTFSGIEGMENVVTRLDEATVKKLDQSKYITVRRNGNKEYYAIDPEIKKTLDSMAPEEADLFDKVFTGFANVFRGSVTLDPPFAANNAFKDGFQQATISRSGTGIPLENQIRGIGLLATKKGRQTWREWKESAANQAIEYGAIMDRRSLLKDMDRQAGRTPNVIFNKEYINPLNWHKAVGRVAGKGVRGLNKTMQVAESVGRVGEYDRVKKKSLKKGFTEAEARAEAEFESADLGDFSMSGRSSKIKKARKWVPFFGSSMSFAYREAGALRDPKTWIKGITVLGGMEALSFLLNHDDPDYWNLPDDQRRRYWHIPTGDGKFVALPKPVGLVSYLFTEPFRRAADLWHAGDDKYGWWNFTTGLFGSVVPPESPQFLKAAVETQIGDAGYSVFYDRPIVNQELQNLPPQEQYTERTSLTARGISRQLGKLGMETSPQKIDYFIGSGLGSGIRRVVETGVDPLISKVTGEPVPGQPLVPSLTKRNVFNPEDKGSEAIDRFYEKLDQAEKAAAADKKGREHDKYSKPELKRMRKTAKRLSDMRKTLKATTDDTRQREIKRRMVYSVRRYVDDDMPEVFQEYEPRLPGRPISPLGLGARQ